MKKFLSVIAVALALVMLGGCSQKVKFNAGLKFTKELTNNEKQLVIAKVVNQFEKVSEVISNVYTKTYNEIQQTEAEASSKTTAYANRLIHTETTTKTTTKSSEITVTQTVKSQKDVYDYRVKKMVLAFESSDNGEVEFSYDEYQDSDEMDKTFYSAYMTGTSAQLLANLNCYESGSGYVFVSQSINKAESYPEEGIDAQLVVTTKRQTIIKVDKNYRVTEYTSMTETLRNRDEATNAWYKKETQTAYTSLTASLKYSEKKKENTKLAENVIDILSGTVVTGVNFDVQDEYGNSVRLNTQVKHNGINTIRVISTFSPTGYTEGDEYMFKALLGYRYKKDFEDKVKEASVLPVENDEAEYDSLFPITYRQGMTVVFEFVITVSGNNVSTSYVYYITY